MTQAPADLLGLACDRIRNLDRPAFIKDHMLRYVAANDAYLSLHGIHPGRSGIFPTYRDRIREGRERQTLATGAEAHVTVTARDGAPLGTAEIERFVTDDGSSYLFGQMSAGAIDDPAADLDHIRQTLELVAQPIRILSPDGRLLVENAAARAGLAADAVVRPADATVKRSVENALEMLDVGVAVFDGEGRLIYRNARMESLYRPVIGQMPIGLSIDDYFGGIYDYGMSLDPSTPEKLGSRDDWLRNRHALFENNYSETTELACDGRWLRCLNRRLENGMRILVRLDVSDLKQQEILLREHVERNELYHSIIEELPVAVFARNSDHRMVFANAAFCTLFGHSREELIGRTELESYGPEGRSIHENNDRVLREDITSALEETLSHSSGRIFSAMSRTSRVDTENGDSYVVGSVVDITDIKIREVALREAQERAESLSRDLSGILSGLPAGVLVFDEHLRVEYANGAFYAVCGLPADGEIRGCSVHHAIEQIYFHAMPDAAGAELLPEKLSLVFERGSEASTEFSTREGRAVMAVSRNLTGGKTLVTFADISELRQQEREITQQQRRLETIGQIMRDTARVMSQGLFVVEDGIITLSNAAAAEMMCLPLELVEPGRHWQDSFRHCMGRGDFGTEEEALRIAAEWREAMQKTGAITASFMADGRRWVQFVATLSARGQVMVVFNDLSEMKNRQRELERLLARSEAADKAKSEFLANMSHEIRTPINGVLGMAELLAKTDLDARQRTFTEIISKSANTLLTIFNDIIDFSKIDSGEMELKPQPFDPLEALEDVAALHSASAAEKNLDILIRAPADVPRRVMGDAGRFRQIVANFLSNAIRHTEQGHVLIAMQSEAMPDRRVMLTVRVEDTGVGIEPVRLKTIFGKFAQGGASEQRHGEGTGLGLAITAGLVELFGGTIEAESEPGAGSAFTVRLPLPAIDIADTKRPVPVNVRGARVLVVDDNALSRDILLDQLAGWGFDCCAAEDAASARAILEAAGEMGVPVDAVLVDYHLVGSEAARLCREIRTCRKFSDTALVLLASMDTADHALIEGLHVQAHVTKPVRANILRNTMIEVLRMRQLRRPHEDPSERTGIRTGEGTAAAGGELSSSGPQAGDNRPVRILVAEDNDVNAFVFRQILTAAGHPFVLAANGEEAVKLWTEHRPDVILMDVSMPVMDGLEATRRIRHMERVADMPPAVIIAVTAHDTESGRELCLSHGMDDYLAKPISPEILEEKLERWLKAPHREELPAE